MVKVINTSMGTEKQHAWVRIPTKPSMQYNFYLAIINHPFL